MKVIRVRWLRIQPGSVEQVEFAGEQQPDGVGTTGPECRAYEGGNSEVVPG